MKQSDGPQLVAEKKTVAVTDAAAAAAAVVAAADAAGLEVELLTAVLSAAVECVLGGNEGSPHQVQKQQPLQCPDAICFPGCQ